MIASQLSLLSQGIDVADCTVFVWRLLWGNYHPNVTAALTGIFDEIGEPFRIPCLLVVTDVTTYRFPMGGLSCADLYVTIDGTEGVCGIDALSWRKQLMRFLKPYRYFIWAEHALEVEDIQRRIPLDVDTLSTALELAVGVQAKRIVTLGGHFYESIMNLKEGTYKNLILKSMAYATQMYSNRMVIQKYTTCPVNRAPLVWIFDEFRAGLGSYMNCGLNLVTYALYANRCSKIIVLDSWPMAYVLRELTEQNSMQEWVQSSSDLLAAKFVHPVGKDFRNSSQVYSIVSLDWVTPFKRMDPFNNYVKALIKNGKISLEKYFNLERQTAQTLLLPNEHLRIIIYMLKNIILRGHEKYLTVHLRSGDKVLQYEMSNEKVEKYVDVAMAIAVNNSISVFFVMSDNLEKEEEFKQQLIQKADAVHKTNLRIVTLRSLLQEARALFAENNNNIQNIFLSLTGISLTELLFFITLAKNNEPGTQFEKEGYSQSTIHHVISTDAQQQRLYAKDIFMLWWVAAQADFIVCTLSSNVCRIMALLRPHSLETITSLDESWHPA